MEDECCECGSKEHTCQDCPAFVEEHGLSPRRGSYEEQLQRWVEKKVGYGIDPSTIQESWYENGTYYRGCDTCGYGESRDPAGFYIYFKNTAGVPGHLNVTVGEDNADYSFTGLMREILEA